jgi:hypothetical protein
VTGDSEKQQLEAPSIAERDTLSKRESGVTDASPMRLRMEQFIKAKQEEIVRALEAVDGKQVGATQRWRWNQLRAARRQCV